MKKNGHHRRVLAHEHIISIKVEVARSDGKKGKEEVDLIGYAFGGNALEVAVCFPKDELELVGRTCKGPCINQMIPRSQVNFEPDLEMKDVKEEKKRIEVDIAHLEDE